MELSETISVLSVYTGKFPYLAVHEAIAQREAITPELLALLERDAGRLDEIAKDDEYIGHLFAMFLLAQFREQRAYPLIYDLVKDPEADYYAILGDFVTESLGRVLASVCGGDLSLIKRLIEDREVDEWVRCQTIQSLVVLTAMDDLSRDEVIAYYASLFREKLERKRSAVWQGLVSAALDLYAKELKEDIRVAFEIGLIDQSAINMADVQEEFARGKRRALRELKRGPHNAYITDTVAEMDWWACFDTSKNATQTILESAPVPPPAPPDLEDDHDEYLVDAKGALVRAEPKTSPNDPCPCGSGRKYKKCCGRIS